MGLDGEACPIVVDMALLYLVAGLKKANKCYGIAVMLV